MPSETATVVVSGLDGEGPGDVVGAFVNEAGVAPETIGDITIDDGEATVEVAAEAVERVREAMDGGRVGRSAVTVRRADEPSAAGQAAPGRTATGDGDGDGDGTDEATPEGAAGRPDGEGPADPIDAYVDEYRRVVESEREAEMRRHEREIESLSGRDRQAKGRALLALDGRDEGDGEGLTGHLVKFVRPTDAGLPDTEIGVGDLVTVSRGDPLREDAPEGTVTRVTGHSVTVAFDDDPPGFVYGDDLRVDLTVSDVTYRRMLDALATLRGAGADPDTPLGHLGAILAGERPPRESTPAEVDAWANDRLTDAQRAAVRRALGSDDVYLIHGPPGTGKTTTAVETIRQCVAAGESVLATAASNAAVDTLVEHLVGAAGAGSTPGTGDGTDGGTSPDAAADDDGAGAGDDERDATAAAAGVADPDVVRVGHPARVTPTLRELTLDARLERHETYRRARETRERAFEVLAELDERADLTEPAGRWRRGMSDERIRELAAAGRGSRGVPPEKIAEMAAWLDRRGDADALFDRADELEAEAVAAVLDEADVVCATNATAGSDALSERRFDTLVIDEATQATEPSCLIPATRADRLVLAGDHRQLPPTVRSESARERLRETLFERLADRYGDRPDVRTTLDTQFRMHETIQAFPDARFYDGVLEPAESVREHTLVARTDADADAAGDGDGGSPPTDGHPDVDPDAIPAGRRRLLAPAEPLTVLNTAAVEAPERQRTGSTSRENPREARVVARLAADLLRAGLDPGALAVISPYDDQLDRIEGELLAALDGHDGGVPDALEVDTVDGFQGREKTTVFVSLVRSNPDGEVGFLDDPRRFNVALTRARRKAVVVGDADTVTAAPTFEAFFAFARERGAVIDLR